MFLYVSQTRVETVRCVSTMWQFLQQALLALLEQHAGDFKL
jgi:hypothetical protein